VAGVGVGIWGHQRAPTPWCYSETACWSAGTGAHRKAGGAGSRSRTLRVFQANAPRTSRPAPRATPGSRGWPPQSGPGSTTAQPCRARPELPSSPRRWSRTALTWPNTAAP